MRRMRLHPTTIIFFDDFFDRSPEDHVDRLPRDIESLRDILRRISVHHIGNNASLSLGKTTCIYQHFKIDVCADDWLTAKIHTGG